MIFTKYDYSVYISLWQILEMIVNLCRDFSQLHSKILGLNLNKKPLKTSNNLLVLGADFFVSVGSCF